ncbi:hypothetical protein ACVRXQ_07650 [Streptococcus panodentis]|uniref:DUF3899 domain-containing protein n=1 Tax=Streptococcus panodentis TaxID=1581472 RepID=A0ABS5AYN6_9STRE|nr:hypothetical protein [Streptococcus panodentis]MBP2621687.1 hypothetical protein [Streptococcus panodentis]
MIIWRGKGLLVILAIIGGGFAGITLSDFILQGSTTAFSMILRCIILILTTSGLNFLLTKWFISKEVRILIDEKTGERIEYRDRSSLFFIPNRYWTWIIAVVLAIIFLTRI